MCPEVVSLDVGLVCYKGFDSSSAPQYGLPIAFSAVINEFWCSTCGGMVRKTSSFQRQHGEMHTLVVQVCDACNSKSGVSILWPSQTLEWWHWKCEA